MTGRVRARAVAAALLTVALGVPAVLGLAVRAEAPAPRVDAIGPISLTVADLDRAVAFYTGVLFFEPLHIVEAGGSGWERLTGVPGARLRIARLRLGEEIVELHEFREPRGRPVPEGSRSNDRWFQHLAIVVNDIDQAFLWLRRHRVAQISPAPQRLPDWNPAAGGIRALYFEDPDGHPLELIQFPPDKGDARWHRPGDRVFLGIDHTAIAVGDTETSLAFYRDLLGLRPVGGSVNWGAEQERLSQVPGARVRITTLRAGAGPGLELLEYLAPRDGRPRPADTRGNDLVHWQTTLVVRDVAAVERALGAARTPLVSAGPVALAAPELGLAAAVTVRDPDGHAVQLRGVTAGGAQDPGDASACPSPCRSTVTKGHRHE